MIFSTSLPLRAGVVEAFWNSRNSPRTSLWSCLQHHDRVLGHVDSSSVGRQAQGAPAVASRSTYPARLRRKPDVVVARCGYGRVCGPGDPPAGAPLDAKECRWPVDRPATPWSSGPGPTAWSPPTPSPTPAGTSCSSRPRTRWAARCAAPRASAPGFVTDLFSAFYPLAAASPVIRDLHLERHGLVWRHAPDVRGARLPRRPVRRAAPRRRPTRQRAWTSTTPATATPGCGWWPAGTASATRCSTPCSRPFPPVRSGLRLLRRSGVAGTLDLTRLALLSVRRLGPGGVRQRGGPGAADRQRDAQRRAPPTARAARCSAGCS